MMRSRVFLIHVRVRSYQSAANLRPYNTLFRLTSSKQQHLLCRIVRLAAPRVLHGKDGRPRHVGKINEDSLRTYCPSGEILSRTILQYLNRKNTICLEHQNLKLPSMESILGGLAQVPTLQPSAFHWSRSTEGEGLATHVCRRRPLTLPQSGANVTSARVLVVLVRRSIDCCV